MVDLDELELNHLTTSPAGDGRSARGKWIALAVVVLVLGGALTYLVVRRPAIETSPAATSEPAATAPSSAPRLEGENIALPPLGATDALVRELVVKLSSHPKVLAWLATNGLIENFTVVTLNMSEGRTPAMQLQALAPSGRFQVRSTSAGLFLDPASYRRYDDYAAAVDGLDATGAARLYLTLKPRIADAYRAQGFPEGDFDAVLGKAIAGLLAVPTIDREIALQEGIASYQFAEPALEALSPAQKQLLRMGPRNAALVQQKLRQIAMLLGLNSDPGRRPQ
jgi:hypothetical protein